MSKKKAMTSQKASYVKRKGHEDAREFAIALGIGKEFKSEPSAKKDVIDENGFSYSVKSGEKKWQIFLYGKTRFQKDPIFQAMNGIGDLFLKCIEAFPEDRVDYLRNKTFYKEKLKLPMKKLCKKLKSKRLLKAFIDKAMFNSGEVDFLVIKSEGLFHVFWGKEVVEALTKFIKVENSSARREGEIDAQKVVFKYNNKTIGEIEMRNDSDIHYREVKFWMSKSLTFDLLMTYINKFDRIILYGKAKNKFKSKTKLKKH
jgi:hypothetical protein